MGGLQDIYQTSEMVCKILGPANTMSKEKIKVGGLTVPDARSYSKTIVIKTVWHW